MAHEADGLRGERGPGSRGGWRAVVKQMCESSDGQSMTNARVRRHICVSVCRCWYVC